MPSSLRAEKPRENWNQGKNFSWKVGGKQAQGIENREQK
jgi:hypothetical protein